ncbi:MAG: hypothetical protein VYA51_12950 [Planctomycetota bacterium]|nr:hypothetical protein [Planctomycetota bacterium]
MSLSPASLAQYVFWAEATPAAKLDRLAFYRTREPWTGSESAFVIATAGPFWWMGLASSRNILAQRQSMCPYGMDPVLCFADPGPVELRRFMCRLFEQHVYRGQFYDRNEETHRVIERLRTHPAPLHCPGVPELPPRLLSFVPRNFAQERKLRAEAIGWYRSGAHS